jgi:hypothetical protein
MAPLFLTLALDGGDRLASRPGQFTPAGKPAGTHWVGGWLDPRASVDAVE